MTDTAEKLKKLFEVILGEKKKVFFPPGGKKKKKFCVAEKILLYKKKRSKKLFHQRHFVYYIFVSRMPSPSQFLSDWCFFEESELPMMDDFHRKN